MQAKAEFSIICLITYVKYFHRHKYPHIHARRLPSKHMDIPRQFWPEYLTYFPEDILQNSS